MNFTNALLVAILAANMPPGAAKTALGVASVCMVATVTVRAIWAGLRAYADAYGNRL